MSARIIEFNPLHTFDKLIEILSHWDSADMQKNPSYTRALIDRINEKYKEVQQT